jgi:hypothetical protein
MLGVLPFSRESLIETPRKREYSFLPHECPPAPIPKVSYKLIHGTMPLNEFLRDIGHRGILCPGFAATTCPIIQWGPFSSQK